MHTRTICAIAVLGLTTVACAREEVIPERFQGQIDRDLRFVEMRQNPEVYLGKVVVVGGEVLSATRREDGTRMEILHRPLSSDLLPRGDQESQGRFVAIDRDGHVVDPALLEERTLATIVGEVVGTDTLKIDGVSKKVPKFRVKQLTVWEWKPGHPGYGYYAPFAWELSGYDPYPQPQ